MFTFKFCLRRNCYLLISRRSKSYSISYSEFGDPVKVLKLVEENNFKSLGPQDVRVKILASSVNPADINTIQGTYGIKGSLPAVGGNEGVAEVIEIGSEVKSLNVGSWVVPSFQGSFNTWRTHYQGHQAQFLQIPNDIPLEGATTLLVNPCTAYRMIKDFVPLKSGDCIIQNGANSGVGQVVIQLAKSLGIKSINIVRKRDNMQELKEYLNSLGADYVITEQDLRLPLMEDIFETIPKPSLAFNCVGGKSTTDMLRHLATGGVMVTYGGMSRQPVTVSTTSFIFKDVTLKGFWMTRWVKDHSESPERMAMLMYLSDALKAGWLRPPKCTLVPFEAYHQAIANAMAPYINQKYILVMDQKYIK